MATATTETTDLREWVREYYGNTLQSSDDLQTDACCVSGPPPEHILKALEHVHTEVQSRFYGCGFPIPEALAGLSVADLGCGTGRDVYILAQLVGESGVVHGVDMTESQLEVPRRTAEWHREKFGFSKSNVEFHQGFIEDLAMLADNSVDLVVSNCVVNLSPRKDLVLAEVFRVLKPGGEFYLSDVFCDRRLPKEVAFDPLLHSECLGGAMVNFDFEQVAKKTGFLDPRWMSSSPISIRNAAIQAKVGAARFTSATVRLFKLPALEPRCEDYGQVAIYKGTIPESGPLFRLDDHHLFESGRPERVCSNTALMLSGTRFAEHFEIRGTTDVHYGEYPCGPTMAHAEYETEEEGGACC